MLKKNLIYSIAIICCAFIFSSCNYLNSAPAEYTNSIVQNSNLIKSCETAANDLVINCNIVIDKSKPIIVTSLVDIDDLDKSSSMGRMAGEIIANRLSQSGYIVKELKMGENKIFIKEGMGEFILSRKLKEIAKNYDVQAVVVGTYAMGEEIKRESYESKTFTETLTTLYVSLRMIEASTNNIGCSVGYSMTVGNTNLWK